MLVIIYRILWILGGHIDPSYNKAVVYKNKSKAIYNINIHETELIVDFVVNDKVIFTFVDILNDGYNWNYFTRVIKNNIKNKEITYKFIDGKVIFKSVKKMSNLYRK